ncbi:MAG: hypothetical protein WC872_00580 [Candidatus Absconditabacterales bacterium]
MKSKIIQFGIKNRGFNNKGQHSYIYKIKDTKISKSRIIREFNLNKYPNCPKIDEDNITLKNGKIIPKNMYLIEGNIIYINIKK